MREFRKTTSKDNYNMLVAEAEGLRALKSIGAIRIPEVISLGTDGNDAFLITEYIESGRGSRESSLALGIGLAEIHMADTESFVNGGRFGFLQDNYIGAGVQINTPKNSWREFFVECRLRPQFERAAAYLGSNERKMMDSLFAKIDDYLVEPDTPSLLHGDLWAGNYMIDNEGNPWLIDPAVYVGHPEADLAMTELFGGFDAAFYDAYQEAMGIDPGYKDRKDLYNLYHLFNHLNIFGLGYLGSVVSILSRYA